MRRRRQAVTTAGAAGSAPLRQHQASRHRRGVFRQRTGSGWLRRPAWPLTVLALGSLGCALVAAIVRSATSFEHGVWLVAYLFLVGFLAQMLLGFGQDSLYRRAGRIPTPTLVRAEAALWNAGVVAVPLGVLIDARIPVVIGSCVLLTALAFFARSPSPSPRRHAAIPTAMAYMALVLSMATSVAVGTALAWDIPWY